jgi:N-acetyl-anhydromuramyl-L-alanine amidase AmpD
MSSFLRWTSVATLVTLYGCGFLPSRLPWQADDSQRSIERSKQLGTNGEDLKEAILPPLSELVDSGVLPLNKTAVESCRKLLALPPEENALAHRTNYGDRQDRDHWGRSLNHKPQLIVLHETVIDLKETVNLFKTPHPEDDQQASYHLLIDRKGNRWRIVPDEKRAYGSGMSAFGDATQRTKPGAVGSINNIALHVSLVSPDDGREDSDAHSGYTDAQYRNLAGQVLLWQAMYGIPMTRVTTHLAIDRSHSRYDPRSFRWDRFDRQYKDAANRCKLSQFDNQQAGL